MKFRNYLLFLCLPLSLTAQVNEGERPDDPYTPVEESTQQTSPPYNRMMNGITILQVNTDANGMNIMNDAANEPSIAVDPTNPDRMAIGWRQFDNINNNFRQAGFAFSLDDGATWTNPGPIQPGIFRSDPVLDFDNQGNLYYNSLSSNNGAFFCDVFKTTLPGNWDDGTAAFGGDKQWMVVDKTGGPGEGNIYAFWKVFLSDCIGDFTRSTDGGLTYEPCVSVPNAPIRGTLAVGTEGEVYACGQLDNTFTVAISSNAWNPDETVAWDTAVIVDLGGPFVRGAGPNPSGMLDQVWIEVDHSEAPTRGNVYMLCSVDPPGADPLDVMFTRSTDGGITWEPPVRINDDLNMTAWQWFGTLDVAPNGRIDVVWYDTRDDSAPGGLQSQLYRSYSWDGGTTWSENEALSDPFNPLLGFPSQNKIGDYIQLISEDEGAHLAWSATFNGEQDVYYSWIPEELVSTNEVATEASYISAFPNPFRQSVTLEYEIRKKSRVELKIFNNFGAEIHRLFSGVQTSGSYRVEWDGKHAGGTARSGGIYYYQLQVGTELSTGKLVYLE